MTCPPSCRAGPRRAPPRWLEGLRALVTRALLVRQVAYGEGDVVATLFTEAEGAIGAIVRGGRKPSRRVGGALEPFHLIEARLDDRGGELAVLREARIVKVRAGITASLEAIDAAGMALRWVRHACPPRTAEPEAWGTLNALLDAIDAGGEDPRVALARGALRLLADVGYGLDLERCVRCGRPCAPGRAARVDPARGGLVCRACGGARVTMGGDLRARAILAQRGEAVALTVGDAEALLALVDAAMAAHAGFDR
jgi:DNA repair protein RecO (recombination protein O)